MAGAKWSYYDVTPSAARLTGSLRDIGYDFSTAIADIVDNSVAAGATNVSVDAEFDGPDSFVMVCDNGRGMTAQELVEAMRFGSRRDYDHGELGRFGLGLKTASLSQCRRLTVVSRRSPQRKVVTTRTLDLDQIEILDKWIVAEDSYPSRAVEYAQERLAEGPGTVVIWEKLDRVIPERHLESGWGKRRLMTMSQRAGDHLAMVFHRFLDGLRDGTHLVITVNGEKLRSWDPFARREEHTEPLPPLAFEVENGDVLGSVRLERFILPAKDRFSTPEEFERLSGPLKWNRQQGLYVYRANRLVQFGGWNGIRSIDEHTKLARASLDFDTDLDEAFQINVAKMRVLPPPSLRPMLEPPVNELCIRAGETYRRSSHDGRRATSESGSPSFTTRERRSPDLGELGVALRAAAMEVGQLSALSAVLDMLRTRAPELWEALAMGD